jgi:putative transposase
VKLNPPRAGLVVASRDYQSSNARTHLREKDDGLGKVSSLLKMAENWRRLLTSAATEKELKQFREHERTGRVLGDDDFQKRLQENLSRALRRQKPGPKCGSTQIIMSGVTGIAQSPELPFSLP